MMIYTGNILEPVPVSRKSRPEKNMTTKYLITDVDGVVFDTMPTILKVFSKAMRRLEIPDEQTTSFLRDSLGKPIEFQIKGIMAKAGKPVSENDMQLVINDFWNEYSGNPAKIFPGVKTTLYELKKRDVRILASSGSTTAELDRLFREFELPYDFFLGSDKILKGDGHIEIFAQHFGVKKTDFCARAVFVGDGTADMQIASHNRIFGIGITNSIPADTLILAGAQAIIANFPEVVKLLEE